MTIITIIYFSHAIQATEHHYEQLKAHYRGADWLNKTIKKKRIRQGSVISLYSEIHDDDNDLFSKQSMIKEHKGLVITQNPERCFDFNITTCQSQPRQLAFKLHLLSPSHPENRISYLLKLFDYYLTNST